MTDQHEPTLVEIDAEAQTLRVGSGFKLTIDQARDRVVATMGWVDYRHCLKCKAARKCQASRAAMSEGSEP